MMAQEKDFPVDFMCEIFEVSRSGYYAWKKRDNSEKEARELRLLRAIEDVHRSSRKNYGSPRIYKQLIGMGHSVGKTKVERMMKKHGIRAKTKRKFRVTTDSKHNLPVAPNLLDRNFQPERPNQVWASDLTYVWTKEGWLFLAVIVDLFSRQVVGWSLDKTMTKELVCSALRQAYDRRRPGTGLLFHSDRGSQYCSKQFRRLLKQYRMLQSQSRKANCWDNACVESFFHTLKTEMIYHENFETRDEAHRAIFEWVEAFYNRQRLHSTLGYKSPVDFERWALEQVA
jgi:transposase InsO family protein